MYPSTAFAVAAITCVVVAYSDDYYYHHDSESPGYPSYGDDDYTIYERAASGDAEAIYSWEEAHGGQPIDYQGNWYGRIPHVHGHYMEAREVDHEADVPVSETSVPASEHAAIPEFGGVEDEAAYDVYSKRDKLPPAIPGIDDIPDFGDEEVDTSLTGYDHDLVARDLGFDVGERDESQVAAGKGPTSSWLTEVAELEIPDFGDDPVDTSLAGYDPEIVKRSLERSVDDQLAAYWAEDDDYGREDFGSDPVPGSTHLAQSSTVGEPEAAVVDTITQPPVIPAPTLQPGGTPQERDIKKWWEHLTADIAKAGKQAGQEIKSVAEQIAHHVREAQATLATPAESGEAKLARRDAAETEL